MNLHFIASLPLLLALASPGLATPGSSAAQAQPTESEGIAEPPDGEPIVDEAQALSVAREISRALRCPVCQGQSVAESNADTAVAMRVRVEELVAKGYSREQIERYFVDRYGAWVLLEPPKEGKNLLIWFAPLIAGGIGAWLLWGALKRRRAEPCEPKPDADEAVSTNLPEDPYRSRIRSELEEP